jgi:hypothetical protein
MSLAALLAKKNNAAVAAAGGAATVAPGALAAPGGALARLLASKQRADQEAESTPVPTTRKVDFSPAWLGAGGSEERPLPAPPSREPGQRPIPAPTPIFQGKAKVKGPAAAEAGEAEAVVDSAAAEQAASNRRQAGLLLECLPPFSLPVRGGAGAKPSEQGFYKAAAVDFICQFGKKVEKVPPLPLGVHLSPSHTVCAPLTRCHAPHGRVCTGDPAASLPRESTRLQEG